ncbi:helix-turn-helix domain-containing protein [Marichromatium gracile]|uniref:helix-turn-helix domain-containing protein n=2 Tax=Marichromatium TaxID=85076 RepID=UPI001F217576|nr:helix-turn-helix domain-containing protein [Marichromatium gracile]MCF1183539.1 helix-turn-helix domain-containing protein [Marichromatium gracile]
MRDLQRRCRFTHQQAAQACCVSERTYRRWLQTGRPNPAALRLLAILAGFMPWDDWQGWEIHRGYLFPPGYRRHGIRPGQFFAIVFYRQQIDTLRRTNAKLQTRIDALEAALADARRGSPSRG